MADKFRVTFPISISFTEGELPPASKLTGIARQAKQGLSKLEYAVGDLWNQSGDFLLNDNPDAALNIPNLARYLGQTALTSPRIPSLPDIEEYTHDFTVDLDKYETRLPYPPAAGSTYSWTTSKSATPEANKGDVNDSNKWWIDTATGEVFVWDDFIVGEKLTYKPVVSGDLGEATFNIIPDPDTNSSYNFRGLKLQYVNGSNADDGFYVFLPPRMPLDTRRVEQSPQDSINIPAHSLNFQGSPNSGTLKFWQSDAVDAATTNGEHYRYVLPKILTEDPDWISSATIPAGFLYLLDSSGTKTIIEGILFSAEAAASPRKWVLVAKGANLSTWLTSPHGTGYTETMLKSTGHELANYPNNGLQLITVGSSLSSAFSSLLASYINHDHSSAGSLVTRRISHNLLANLFDVYPAGGNYFDASKWHFDDHPQYLHRYGAKSLSGNTRDCYKNSMLGELVLGSTSYTSNYLNLTGDSHKLSFGNLYADGGYSLFWNASASALEIAMPTGAARTFRINLAGSTNSIDFIIDPSGSGTNTIESNKPLTIENQSHQAINIIPGTHITVSKYGQENGKDGTIYCNSYKSGRSYDSLYGYTGSEGVLEGYGPVRVHNIYASDWHINCFKAPVRVPTDPAVLTQYRPSPAANYVNIEQYHWVAPGETRPDPTTRLVVRLVHYNDSTIRTQLFRHINLPFGRYCIVNVRLLFTVRLGIALKQDSLHFALGYDINSYPTGGWQESDAPHTVSITERYYSLLGLPNGDLPALLATNLGLNMWTPSNNYILANLGSIPPAGYDWVVTPWARLDLDHDGGNNAEILILGVQVLYRIKEF